MLEKKLKAKDLEQVTGGLKIDEVGGDEKKEEQEPSDPEDIGGD